MIPKEEKAKDMTFYNEKYETEIRNFLGHFGYQPYG